MATADFDAGQIGRDQCHGNAEVFRRPDQVIRVIGLEGKPKQRRDRAERDVALMPVETQPEHFASLEIALADDAAVDHRRGIRAGFGAGQAKAGNFPAVGKPRQPLLLLILGAEAHQEFAGAERVRHHHGDGGRHRTRRNLAHHFRMRVGREAQPAIFLRNDHAEEFFPLDEVPDLFRQVAQFPTDLPFVEHRAERIDRAVEKRLLFGRQHRRRVA